MADAPHTEHTEAVPDDGAEPQSEPIINDDDDSAFDDPDTDEEADDPEDAEVLDVDESKAVG